MYLVSGKMRYVSTHGGVGFKTFEEVLFSGYAEDGGLFVPEKIPKVSLETFASWRNLSYPEVVEKVVSLYVTENEVPLADLKVLIKNAFKRFDIDEVIKIESFGDLYISELWHGPTLAFKDLAMSCVGEFYGYFLPKRNKHVTIIVGTSGDTGSSAIEAVRGKPNLNIIVILPHNRISKIQELMMTTVLDDNVHVYGADGSSDDLDVTIKSVLGDAEFVRKHSLCSINSINWSRVMVQIAHHIYMYLQVTEKVGDPLDIVIPTGACGNLASGVFAQAMGIPVKFVSVVNTNDIIHRTIQKNDFSVRTVVQSLSCSMDIQIPANFDRVVWVYSGEDSAVAKQFMGQFYKTGKSALPGDLYKKISENLRTAYVTDDETIQALKKCWTENKYLACPHTCAALAYYYGFSKEGTRQTNGTKLVDGSLARAVVVSTASIGKFPEILTSAGIEQPEESEAIKNLFSKKTKIVVLRKEDNWENIVREKIESISNQ